MRWLGFRLKIAFGILIIAGLFVIMFTVVKAGDRVYWLPIALVILIVSGLVYVTVREKVYEQKLFGKRLIKRAMGELDSIWWAILILYYLSMFVGMTEVGYYAFDSGKQEHAIASVVGAAAIMSFIMFQLPRLMKPDIYVLYYPSEEKTDNSGKYYTLKDTPERQINLTLEGKKEKLLYFGITNLGVNRYQNCICWFTFPEGVIPLEDEVRYINVDYGKKFQLQRGKRCAMFLPNVNYQSSSIGVALYFPVWVQFESSSIDGKVDIEVASETRRGVRKVSLKLKLV